MESTFDKEITLDCLQKIKDIPAMIPVVKKIISDLGHSSAPLRHVILAYYICRLSILFYEGTPKRYTLINPNIILPQLS